MPSNGEYVLEKATYVNGNGWGFEVYCTFSPSITLSNPPKAIQSESAPTCDSVHSNSNASQAIARIKQWMEHGLRANEDSPMREPLQQCLRWAVHYMPGASIEDVRSAFKESRSRDAENFPGNDDENEDGEVAQAQRMCLMVEEATADAVLAALPPENGQDLYAEARRDIFAIAVDPDYKGESQVLAQTGRGKPPPYPATGVH